MITYLLLCHKTRKWINSYLIQYKLICLYLMLPAIKDKTRKSQLIWMKQAPLPSHWWMPLDPRRLFAVRGGCLMEFQFSLGACEQWKGIGNIQLHTSLHTVCIEPWWAWSRWGVTGISSKVSGPCICTSTIALWMCGCCSGLCLECTVLLLMLNTKRSKLSVSP